MNTIKPVMLRLVHFSQAGVDSSYVAATFNGDKHLLLDLIMKNTTEIDYAKLYLIKY
ncbi:MAG: hypothetical protein ACLR7D_05845 [Lachnospira eligens]